MSTSKFYKWYGIAWLVFLGIVAYAAYSNPDVLVILSRLF